MMKELTEAIEDSGVVAGWIKVSAGDAGLEDCEAKVLRAAARAGAKTGAAIGSHTIAGRVVMDQLRIVEECGYDPRRFIWIHAQAEKDRSFHSKVAQRGAWLEYDGIGWKEAEDAEYIESIRWTLDSGFEDRVLLSQDRGWVRSGLRAGEEGRCPTPTSRRASCPSSRRRELVIILSLH